MFSCFFACLVFNWWMLKTAKLCCLILNFLLFLWSVRTCSADQVILSRFPWPFQDLFLSLLGWIWLILFIYLYFLLLFKYSFSIFTPTRPHTPPHPHLPPSNLPPLALSMGPLYMFLDGPFPISPPYPSPAASPWLLSVCSLFQCLWLYFACLFVLLVRFHL